MSENIKLQLKKIIKAPRSRAFAAWTQPEAMKKWFAPGDMTVPNAQVDLKVGGQYVVKMHGAMQGDMVEPTVSGTYTKIVPNEVLCFTWAWQGQDAPESTVTVEFKDIEGGTEITLTHERLASSEARDKHAHGWEGCLVNLAKFLER